MRRRFWARRLVTVGVMSLVVTVGAPLGQPKPLGPVEFPLAGLFELLTTRPAWSLDKPDTPRQGKGRVDPAHEVSVDKTRANGGNGRKPGKVAGALGGFEPRVLGDQPEQVSGKATVGYRPETSKRRQSETSAKVDVFENADGSISRITYAEQVNFRGGDGVWRPIDTTLIRLPDGRLKTAASEVTVEFAGVSGPSWGGAARAGLEDGPLMGADTANALVTLTYLGGERISYGLAGAAGVEPAVAGSTAIYGEVLAHTDLELVALGTGIKETLILRNRDAATEWVFPLTLSGLTARLDQDGSIGFRNATGTVVAVIPPGYMRDSAQDGSGDGASSHAIRFELITQGGRPALKVTADRAWIHDSARVFPVRVDPTITPPGNQSTYVQSPFTNNNSGSTELKTGYHSSGPHQARSFVKFDSFSTGYLGHRVNSATLKVHVFWSGSCPSSRSSTIKAHDVNAWTASAVTNWGNQPALWGEMGSVTAVPNATVCGNGSQNPTVGQWWDIPLGASGIQTVNRWTAGGVNNGLAIVAEVGTADNDTWKKISSVNTIKAPALEVVYTPNERPQIEAMFPPHGYPSPTLTPELIVSASDLDNWPSPLTYRFKVTDTAGTEVAGSGSTPIASRSWVVPSGVLEWGKTYVWAAVASDGAGPSQTFPAYTFTTAVPQALITSGLSQNSSDRGFEPRIGNFTTQVTDANLPAAGPPLSITRAYNSRDPRLGAAFGAGWSSVLDAKLTIGSGSATVTYPSGQEVAFGLKADGSYAPPSGGMATTLKPAVTPATGFVLTDNLDNTFNFSVGTGPYLLGSITDAYGRTLELRYVSGQVRQIVSLAANRQLNIDWTGGPNPRVDKVYTDPLTVGVPTSAHTWTYHYDGDKLDRVCLPEPVGTPACLDYDYGTSSLYPTAVLDAGPQTYLRLAEVAGAPTAASSAVDSFDPGVGTYVSMGTPATAALPGTTALAATFNGTSSRVELAKSAALSGKYQTVSLRFRTTPGGSGVLYSRSTEALSPTTGSAHPVLYVGTDGKLYGQFWNGVIDPIVTAGAVNNGAWHHVTLTAAGNTQTMYLNGSPVTVTPAQPNRDLVQQGFEHAYLGAGRWTGWTSTTGDVSHFAGQIGDFALHTRPLTAAQVQFMHNTSLTASAPMTRILKPSTKVQSVIEYDQVSGTVSKVTDENGGIWVVQPPFRTDGGQVYRSVVLGQAPKDYYRLADLGPETAFNEINGEIASYHQVTLGVDGGPFGHTLDVASFNGSTSLITLPLRDRPRTDSASASMWFKMPAGSTAGGVLWGYEKVSGGTAQHWIPGLYVGPDGRLRAQMFWTGSTTPMEVTTPVNDGNWHHVAVTGNPATGLQAVYLDGVQTGTLQATIDTSSSASPSTYNQVTLGSGRWNTWPSAGAGPIGYWPGEIAEFAFFGTDLNAGQVQSQFAARTRGSAWLGYHAGTSTTPATAATRLGRQCSNANSVTGAGDFNNDTKPDLVCRDLGGTLLLYRGNGSGGFVSGGVEFGWGFGIATNIMWPGDFSGDGKPDMVIRRSSDAALVMYRGDASGGFITSNPEVVGTGWGSSVFTVGDFSGDNKPDFFLIDGSGSLLLYRGNGASGWIDTINLGGDWRGRDQIGGRGDFDGDGKADILFRNMVDKHMYMVRGNGTGGFLAGAPVRISDGHGDKDAIFAAGDFTGDGRQDLMFRSTIDPDRPVELAGVPTKTVRVTDPGGNQIENVFDLSNGGRQIEVMDARQGRTLFGYDTGGFLRTVTDQNGNMTITERDARGNIKAQVTCQDQSAEICSTTYYEYVTGPDNDPRTDKLKQVRDGRSDSATDNRYLTTYTYDVKGNLTEITDALGRQTRHEFTTGDLVVSDRAQMAGSGRYVRIYGTARGTALGYTLAELEVYGSGCTNLALGKTVTASSTASGTTAGAVDGQTTTRWVSAAADPQWIQVDLGSEMPIDRVRLTWDKDYGSAFRIEVSNDALNWTVLATETEDGKKVPAGLTSGKVTPGGGVERVSYSENGDVDRVVDVAGLATCFRYDRVGRMVRQVISSDTHPALVTTIGYDRLDRVTTLTEPPAQNRVTGTVHTKVTTNVYDPDGNVTSATFADSTGGDASRTVSMVYNNFGQRTEQHDAVGNIARYEYDIFGRVKRQISPDTTVTEAEYDATGNQIWTKVGGAFVEWRAYDKAGRLARVTDAMQWETSFTYTDNNLPAITTRRDPVSGNTFVEESNSYDRAGNLISETVKTIRTDFGVDAVGRTEWQRLDPLGANRLVSYTFGPDDTVRSTTVSGATGTQTTDALYDPAGRVIWQGIRMPGGTGGPDGWWQLNEVTGTTAADSTAALRHGTTANVTWTDGGARFTGSGAITTAGPVVATTQSFTVSTWAKIPSAGGGGVIASQEGNWRSGFEVTGYGGGTWSANKPCGEGNWGAIWLDSGAPVVPDRWTHVAVVFDSSASVLKLYVDGVLRASGSNCGNGFDAAGSFVVGRGKYATVPSGHFGGGIDNVQAYHRAATAQEMVTLYEKGRSGSALGSQAITTSWNRDQAGLATSQTDANGAITTVSYDEAGRPVQTQSPTVNVEENGVVTAIPVVGTVGYDTFGGVTYERDGRGLVTRYEYTANGQLRRVLSPDYIKPGTSAPIQSVVTNTYNNMGRVSGVVDPLGRTTSYTYDVFGQVKTVRTPDLGLTTYNYHPDGRQQSVTDPTGAATEFTHDYLGRPATTTQLVRRTGQPTLALITSYVYHEASGLLKKVVSPDPARGSTVYQQNGAGETISATDAAGNVTQYGYDFAGRPTLTTLPGGSRVSTGYDSAGRTVAQERLGVSGSTVLAGKYLTYDGVGNVLTAKDARNTVMSFTYDALGRMTQATEPTSAISSIISTFGYDANSSRTRFTDGRGSGFRTTYNSWNLVESKVDMGGATFTNVYDIAGRLEQALSPGGVSVAYTYDNLDNLTRAAGTGAEVATADRTFGYDGVGRMTSLSGPGGTNALTYDDRGLLTSVTGPSGNSSYAWTNDGLLSSRIDDAGTTDYTYDTAGRLATVANSTAGLNNTYSYNSLSQVNQITYGSNGNRRIIGHDNLHRMTTDELKTSGGTSIGKITYGWDLNDNLTSKTTAGFAGAAANSYTYDFANRLTGWTSPSGTIGYAYDKSGNRTQAGAITFSYDAANRLSSSSDGTSYTYTARGTLNETIVGSINLRTYSDAFNQVTRQDSSPTQYSEYTYDGLGRALKTGFAYTGLGNDLAKDPTATYVRDPSGGIIGARSGGSSSYVWADRHTDAVGQFTATGSTLTGSTTFDPWGKVLTTTGIAGSLGYQSEWTDSATKRVNMHARWYNPDTGRFDSRDTVSLSPVPDSVNANRWGYANANPLTGTDPTGHANSDGGGSYGGGETEPVPVGACNRPAEWFYSMGSLPPPCVEYVKNNPDGWGNDVGFNGRTGQTVNSCPHGNYDWIFPNCTGVGTYGDGTSCIGDKFDQRVCFNKDQLAGLNPTIIAAKIDKEVGKRGGYGNNPNAAAYLTGVVLEAAIETAVQHQQALDEKIAAAKCSADFWCNNAGWIGAVAGVVAGVGCGLLLGWTGVGAVACGFVGGFVAGLVTGALQGKSGAQLWIGAAIGGVIGAATGGILSGVGAGLGVLASRALGSTVGKAGTAWASSAARGMAGKAASTAIGKTVSGAASRVTAGISNITAKATARFGSCATTAGVALTTGLAGVAMEQHSFDPNTKVLMADGTTKAIKDVNIGDKVLATDPESGQTTTQPVTALHHNLDRDLVAVQISPTPPQTPQPGQGNGEPSTRGPTTTLYTTQHHPFWDTTTKTWVNAANLTPQTTLTSPNHETQYVTGVYEIPGFKYMRDLTVANTHTYYVLAGQTSVLVHNCPSNVSSGGGSSLDIRQVLRKRLDDGLPDISHLPALRQQYVREVHGLSRLGLTMMDNGASMELTARIVSAQRRIIGVHYKDLTPPDLLEGIYARNVGKYQDPLGPTIPWLRNRGKSWEEIIESSTRFGGSDLGLGV